MTNLFGRSAAERKSGFILMESAAAASRRFGCCLTQLAVLRHAQLAVFVIFIVKVMR